jgi:hypothetical protein
MRLSLFGTKGLSLAGIKRSLVALSIAALSLFALTTVEGHGKAQTGANVKPSNPVQTELPFRAVENVSAPVGWKRYQFGDPVLFSVVLPGEPVASSNSEARGDENGVVHLFLARDGMSFYGLSYGRVREATDRLQQRRAPNFLAGVVDGIIRMIKEKGVRDEPKVGELRSAKVAGLDGYEVEAVIGRLVITARAATLGDNLYAIYVMRSEEGSASNRSAFFNSFEIRGPR